MGQRCGALLAAALSAACSINLNLPHEGMLLSSWCGAVLCAALIFPWRDVTLVVWSGVVCAACRPWFVALSVYLPVGECHFWSGVEQCKGCVLLARFILPLLGVTRGVEWSRVVR